MKSPELTENAITLLKKRYLARDVQGSQDDPQQQESPEELFYRVAKAISEGDLQYGRSQQDVDALTARFYALMAERDFLPNSPALINAGKAGKLAGQLSACFVLPIEDDPAAISETLKLATLIHQSGGGTGFSFSRLSRKDAPGPIAVMETYSAALAEIKQGGIRPGANMGILRIDHPEIEDFIQCKNDVTRLHNFNISVAVTDAFMNALQQDALFPLVHPNQGTVVRSVSARVLFDQIVESAWKTGEPGLLFIDRINAAHPFAVLGVAALGEIEATNPCGETPLLPYEACTLGSINLSNMVLLQASSMGIDWDKLTETVHLAVHFLENTITQNHYPDPRIRHMAEGNRKIGLGVMGWADLLLKCGIPYHSPEAVSLAHDIASWIQYQSKLASVELARQRGAFPNFSQSRFVEGNWHAARFGNALSGRVSASQWEALDTLIRQYGLRHATVTCIAPTGSISLIAGVSAGIEPLFSTPNEKSYIPSPLEGASVSKEYIPSPLEGASVSKEYIPSPLEGEGRVGGKSDIRNIFVTAHEISFEWHIRMQAAFQAFCDNAVSKTVNFPASATRQDISKTFLMAYESGCKGVTVYRDNCRHNQPMVLQASTEIPTCRC